MTPRDKRTPAVGGRRLVYSTDSETLAREVARHEPQRRASADPSQATAAIRREKKGRAGKTVTTVSGLPMAPDALDALGRQLRQACGSGGTVKDGVIEIQGDHRERVAECLRGMGYKTKFVGG